MLKLVTQRQNVSWYWIWKFTLPERTDTTVPIPSTAMKAWSKHNFSKPLEKEQRENINASCEEGSRR